MYTELGRNLTKREFLGLMGGLLTAACIPTTVPEQPRSQEQFVVPTLQQLGQEVDNWRLRNGLRVADKFPEARQAIDLLSGLTNPKRLFPYAASPIEFSTNPDNGIADLNIDPAFEQTGSRRIVVTNKNGSKFELPVLKHNLPVQIRLSPEVMDSTIRYPIAIKEASQLNEFLDYCRVYVSLLKQAGTTFILQNPDNIPTSEAELTFSIALIEADLDKQETGRSWLHEFVDIGSFIRVGGLAFANWYSDQVQSGFKPSGRPIEVGSSVAGFLQSNNLIRMENNMFVWTTGKAPAINSQQFLDLFDAAFAGRK